jgi:hypothetical protein
MKSSIKSLILVASAALCLMAMPAFSAQSQSDNQDNTSSIGCKIPGELSRFSDNAPHNASNSLSVSAHYSGSGFATSDSQYHTLKIGIVGAVAFDIAKINGLISDNKTLAQIKSDVQSEIYSEMDAAPYNGTLVLGNDYFLLSNIQSKTTSDDNSTLDADVTGPITFEDKSNATNVVGHISLAVSSHENSIIGKGKLTMNNGDYSGEYDALIKMNSDSNDLERIGIRQCKMKCRGGMKNMHCII